jgi:glutathione synthase/RimK-type ligase-like ATP-grasp enzyme
MIKRLAWVTTDEARGRDEDEPVGLAALARTGTSVEVVSWHDPAVDWTRFDRVVLRSAWDYPQHLSAFLTWLDRVAEVSDLVNPPAMVRWSLDKSYLAELDHAGVPVTLTTFVRPGEQPSFPAGDFVVKPAIGAGSRDAASYAADDHAAATAHVARLHDAGSVVLVQPFVASVATDGEWPLVFFGGRFSHAASKRVALPRAGSVDDLFAEETNTGHVASVAQIEVAQAAIDHVCSTLGTPAYARVDLVRGDAGDYRVLEVELVEPSLFLAHADAAAADRLAEVLTGERSVH